MKLSKNNKLFLSWALKDKNLKNSYSDSKAASICCYNSEIVLNLKQTDLDIFNLNLERIESFSDISFLFGKEENIQKLINQSVIKSENPFITSILNMNKTSKTKFFIELICLNRIEIAAEFDFFNNFFDKIHKSNFLFIYQTNKMDEYAEIRFTLQIEEFYKKTFIISKSFTDSYSNNNFILSDNNMIVNLFNNNKTYSSNTRVDVQQPFETYFFSDKKFSMNNTTIKEVTEDEKNINANNISSKYNRSQFRDSGNVNVDLIINNEVEKVYVNQANINSDEDFNTKQQLKKTEDLNFFSFKNVDALTDNLVNTSNANKISNTPNKQGKTNSNNKEIKEDLSDHPPSSRMISKNWVDSIVGSKCQLGAENNINNSYHSNTCKTEKNLTLKNNEENINGENNNILDDKIFKELENTEAQDVINEKFNLNNYMKKLDFDLENINAQINNFEVNLPDDDKKELKNFNSLDNIVNSAHIKEVSTIQNKNSPYEIKTKNKGIQSNIPQAFRDDENHNNSDNDNELEMEDIDNNIRHNFEVKENSNKGKSVFITGKELETEHINNEIFKDLMMTNRTNRTDEIKNIKSSENIEVESNSKRKNPLEMLKFKNIDIDFLNNNHNHNNNVDINDLNTIKSEPDKNNKGYKELENKNIENANDKHKRPISSLEKKEIIKDEPYVNEKYFSATNYNENCNNNDNSNNLNNMCINKVNKDGNDSVKKNLTSSISKNRHNNNNNTMKKNKEFPEDLIFDINFNIGTFTYIFIDMDFSLRKNFRVILEKVTKFIQWAWENFRYLKFMLYLPRFKDLYLDLNQDLLKEIIEIFSIADIILFEKSELISYKNLLKDFQEKKNLTSTNFFINNNTLNFNRTLNSHITLLTKEPSSRTNYQNTQVEELFAREFKVKRRSIPLTVYPTKTLVIMEQLNKIIIYEKNYDNKIIFKTENSFILYPQINHTNQNIIELYKNCLSLNYNELRGVYFGAFLSKIMQKPVKVDNIISRDYTGAYMISFELAKKILKILFHQKPYPTNKDFYIIKLDKIIANSKLAQDLHRRRESKFVLDCVNQKKSFLKVYQPLNDNYLKDYFSIRSVSNTMREMGFKINKGKILEPEKSSRASKQETLKIDGKFFIQKGNAASLSKLNLQNNSNMSNKKHLLLNFINSNNNNNLNNFNFNDDLLTSSNNNNNINNYPLTFNSAVKAQGEKTKFQIFNFNQSALNSLNNINNFNNVNSNSLANQNIFTKTSKSFNIKSNTINSVFGKSLPLNLPRLVTPQAIIDPEEQIRDYVEFEKKLLIN